MKLCLFECLAYLYHCGYRQFSRFLRKIVKIVLKFLIKPQVGIRIHGNMSYEPLTTFLQRTMRSVQCAGAQERQKVIKGKNRHRGWMTTSPIREHAPTERTKTKFGMKGRVTAVIIRLGCVM